MNSIRLFVAGAVALLMADNAHALRKCEIYQFYTQTSLEAANLRDCTVAYALDNDVFFVRAGGSWVGLSTLASITGDEGGTFANGTANQWALSENNETLVFDFSTGDQLTMSSATGLATLLTAMDLSLSGGAGALTLTDSASSIVLNDNDTTALLIGSTDQLNLLTIDTGDDTETVIVTGTTATTAFHVDVGESLLDEKLTIGAGAGALTLTNSAASVLTIDNDTSALDIGSTGIESALRYSSFDNLEAFTFNAGQINAVRNLSGGNVTLDASDCGKTMFSDESDDTFAWTLPATIAGCRYTFMYKGTDGGALVDISPNASDAIHGSCTLAASVVEFNGTDDNDVGFTKTTINTGDTMTLIGDGVEGWYVTACAGIAANN